MQDRVIDLRQRLEGFPMVAAMKSLLARHRGVPGLARTAPPLCPLDPADAQTFADRMEEGGLVLS